jgi:UDP-N-acetylglucosamine diphosphorylase / glucose-1-phosphate thymidylyltransferase / UDP-N-acetylgalactosamine diphosphorylase / glucosamine-1-phosphate N-acetyltransferase / galactosamine-1-phosphate N-acetyltransferase
MIIIDDFIKQFSSTFVTQINMQPWDITANITSILNDFILQLDNNFDVQNGVAIHKTATIENSVVLKPPIIIGENCFVGTNAYLRGGVYLGNFSKVGTSCEIKSSIIFKNSNIAHFNFIGDSIIGNNVNFEAGSLTANHYNERTDKKISVLYKSTIIDTKAEKFGSLVGDNSKIGANAVLSPGTILDVNTVVKRLELIDQLNKR